MKIVCFGDSLTNGEIGYSYRDFLDEQFNTINKGIDGDTIYSMYHRLKHYIENYNDDTINTYIIFIGINDILFQTSTKEDLLNTYNDILILLKLYNKKIVIVGLPYVEYFSFDNNELIEINKKINKLSKKFKAEYIDIFSLQYEQKKKGNKLTLDGVHFNKLSAMLLAEKINKALNKRPW